MKSERAVGQVPTARGDQNSIEILGVDLLDHHRSRVNELKKQAASLGIGFGWHYLLDLVWILAQLEKVEGAQILDAGAGSGLMQWYLAAKGARVSSVDRMSRADLPLRYRAHYRVEGMRAEDLNPPHRVLQQNLNAAQGLGQKSVRAVRGLGGLVRIALPVQSGGKVIIYNHDLDSLPLIPNGSQDAVVAVSALEHNDPAGLAAVVDELLRVLKPGGLLAATLGAARDEDWFHQPSQGWCYTAGSLKQLFQLPEGTPDNYKDYDAHFEALRNCAELKDNLADFYFKSGDNGMPWGKWDPQYQPVGVRKIKDLAA